MFQDEIEEDRRALKKQLNEANEKLKSLGDRERLYSEVLGDQMNAPVPDKLLKKIKVLIFYCVNSEIIKEYILRNLNRW